MTRTVLVLILGVVLGAAAGYGLSRQDSGLQLEEGRFAERPPPRDLVDRDDVTAEAVETLRESRFSSVRTIEDTLALPTDFAETEALYALAGRSNASELQELVYQAARIREHQDRNYAINILLGRLTELDPRSAVAIAASPLLAGSYPHERQVWVAWARFDFDAALKAATETSGERRHRVAQALYSSLRQIDSVRDDAILDALGARVSLEVISKRVTWLAEDSPASAVSYIESLKVSSEQRRAVQALALSLGARLANDGREDNARAVADLFESAVLGKEFLNTVRYRASQHDPEAVLSELEASGQLRQPRGLDQALTAIGQLARRDPERARAFVDRLEGQHAMQAIQSIAFMLVEVDPEGTLEWVRARDDAPGQPLLVGVLTQLASSNPDLALAEAELIDNPIVRERAVAGIVQSAANVDPEGASLLLAMLHKPHHRRQALQHIATQWAAMDPDGAIAWQSRLPEHERSGVLRYMASSLVYTDIDAAMSLLPSLDEGSARELASTIVGALGQRRSYEEAMAFVDRYQGQPLYDALKIQAVTSLAGTDPDRAMAVLLGMPRSDRHDQIVAHVVQRVAVSDPDKALRWSDRIADETARTQTRTMVVQNWFSNDPSRAMQYFNALPVGTQRDSIAAAVAPSLGMTDPQSARQVLDSIGDPAVRSQALASYAMQTYMTDPVAAEQLLNDADIDPAMRERYLQMMRQSRSAAVW